MRANTFAGQVIAVLSRRASAFELDSAEPQTFPGRLRALLSRRRRTDTASRTPTGAGPVTAIEKSQAEAPETAEPPVGWHVVPPGQPASEVMTGRIARLGLYIETDSEADAVGLRKWLLELDIESADLATGGQAPPGRRAGEILVTGALTVVLARSSLAALLATVQLWVSSRLERSVKLEIDGDVLEANVITPREQCALIKVLIDRHADR